MIAQKIIGVFIMLISVASISYAGGDIATKFTYRGSIINTRHNLTQGPIGDGAGTMNSYRNNYLEVCVYCHTPHGANTTVTLPLWNRTILGATTYTTYNQLNTSSLTQTVSQPGNNSLACLSCHDGQTAMDSIINMPGSGRYLKSQETTVNTDFLTAWNGGPRSTRHHALSQTGCLSCHSPTGGVAGEDAADFTVAEIGKDLRNDHPVGVTFPEKSGPGTDFKKPGGTQGTASFFELENIGRMDPNEIRLYANGSKLQVECASCHDPHGVPSNGRDSQFFPTFLRASNDGSALCMTCHIK